ncbi:MAG: HPr(Ser) kinase/phosphatase [Oscillospiraceae bacterium]|jgi:HPr kinase/phosphorylase|nr:HPr(Ser) kinase/phosphatase [Oscillospiraceae bacterium]
MSEQSVLLSKLAELLQLKIEYAPNDFEARTITTSAVNRPGLQLVGFFTQFDNTRLQFMGIVEIMYLKTLPSDERRKVFTELFKRNIPALVICNNMEIYAEALEQAQMYETPLFSTGKDTSLFSAEIIARLNAMLAPSITRHGVLVEVYGEGIFMTGDSGSGKSETAIELIKRGHMLVADDAVEIKRVSYDTLIGSAPDLIRHYMEIRGIGVIDVRRLYGMGAVSNSTTIDLIIDFQPWSEHEHYDRLGADINYTELLNVKVPSMLVPVAPGRNLAVIVEVAAMNNKQRKMGFNAARALQERLLDQLNGHNT